MKTLSYIASLWIVFAAVSQGQNAEPKSAGAKVIEGLSEEKIELTIPKVGAGVDRVVLENGMTIFLYEDRRFPLLNATAMIHCGGIYDPLEKNGLSSLVGTVMRSGGTKSISGDSLNILMEFAGGILESQIGTESGSVSLGVLSKDTDLGLKLLSDLLRNPAFPQEKLELAKTDMKNSIRRRNDDPNRVASTYFSSTVYGDHPYGRMLDWSSVKTITVEDLAAYHKRFFVPNGVMLGISGDFDKKEMLAKIKTYFGDWQKSDQPLPTKPEVKAEYHPGVYQVIKDINQAYLMIGELGIKRDNPDRYAVDLLNYILGGGSFTSRLTGRVRSDEGLAYRVGSRFDINSSDLGEFAANCQTKSSTAHKATRLITEEIANISKDGVTADELIDAQNSITNRLVFSFDSAAKIVRNLMSLEFDGYPADFYDQYLDNYAKVTMADVKAAAEKYLKPEQMTYIVVGKPETFEKSLDEFGKVTNIELVKPVVE
ncbi:MAG: pitrilysin family protein [Candidatus Zixiibacteriota bacterium]